MTEAAFTKISEGLKEALEMVKAINSPRDARAPMLANPRPSARARGYDTRWQKARLTFLAHHPLCRMCEEQGRIEPATVVDHIIPHRGDQSLFWDTSNWQPLCKPHHDATKQAEERRGHAIGSAEDGRPLDPQHPWNR